MKTRQEGEDDTRSQEDRRKKSMQIKTQQEEDDDTRSQDDRRKKSIKITTKQEEEEYEDHNKAGERGL